MFKEIEGIKWRRNFSMQTRNGNQKPVINRSHLKLVGVNPICQLCVQ